MVDLDTETAFGPDAFARARTALTISLARQGLGSGDRVIVALSNGPLFIAALTSILACEASPLVVHFKTPAAELLRYAQRFGARWLACQSNDETDVSVITRESVEIPFGQRESLCWTKLNVAESDFPGPVLRGVPLHPTSGSTGLPKIALRPGFAAIEEARHYAATMAIDADDTIVAIPPMSHAYGYGMCVMVPLLTGASIVSTRRFSIKLIKRALAEYKPSILPTVPAMLDTLSFGGQTDLSEVRWVLTAGAMLPHRSAEQFRAKTGVTPCPLYGTTETGGISVATAADGQDVDGRVGPPMDGISVEARAGEGAAELGPGGGKLFVRSSSQMVGYLDDQGRITNPASEGWFETGDLARIEDDGTIHLRGRDSEVVNVSGLKVVPCEVEEAITQLPGVLEVKVYAGEHRSGTQIVKAAVAVDGAVSEADIRAHCERHLVYYKRPQVVTLVEALPRTPTGKINRDQLP
ncbi:MAG TPA: class I adenylate-forming enzyme family protein [Pirellulales bacterium]|nr:class I adenylate-forming enzyme family protein [Pirellulales bacterium]